MKKIYLIAALGCSASALYAQTKIDTAAKLPEVIVSYQAGKKTPVTYQELKGKELAAKSTGQEPSFLLTSETPSVTVYSDAGSTQGYSYYRMRGIDQTRINTTLDGMPLNEPEDQGAYFSNYPDVLNSVSKIQVQRGAGTTQNGSASYAGSIQLFSPDLTDPERTTVGLSYGSFNSLRVFGAYNSGIKNHKALYVRASELYSDGYKYHSSNHSQSVFISGGLFYDKTTWKLNIMAGHQQNHLAWIGVADSLINEDRRTNANTSAEKDRYTQALIQAQNRWQISNRSVLNSSIYYNFLDGSYDFDADNYIGMPSTGTLYNYAVHSSFTGFFTNYTYTVKHLIWTTGINGDIYSRRHTGSESTEGRLYENTGYKNELSAYTKAEYSIHKLTLFADAQYRYATFNYKGSVSLDRISWHFFNPKAGVSYMIAPSAVVYYSIGRTGREPTRNDMFGGNDDLPADSTGKAVLGNTDPEYVTDHELGLRYHSGRVVLNANLYYMNFKNEIVLNGQLGPNGLALTNNVDRSFRTGAELSLSYKISKHFSMSNNSSFNYCRIKEQTETFTPVLTPPLIINHEFVYAGGQWLFGLGGRYQGKSFIDFANTAAANSYVLLNARAQYNTGRYQFAVFLNNIANAKYFNNGYVDYDGTKKYFVQAPVNYSLSVKYSF
ncbi:TonB-dependent receptor [Chitinophagaceae bacterium MMS25-I14]